MNWLVTVDQDADLAAVGERLRGLGCADVDTGAAVPTSDGEISIPVTGPKELPVLVQGDPTIRGVWENSDIALS